MKILICMITSMANRGVDALVASKAAQLGAVFPGAQIDVLTRDTVINQPFLEPRGLRAIEDPFYGRRQRMLDKLAEDREARETRRHGRGPGRRGR